MSKNPRELLNNDAIIETVLAEREFKTASNMKQKYNYEEELEELKEPEEYEEEPDEYEEETPAPRRPKSNPRLIFTATFVISLLLAIIVGGIWMLFTAAPATDNPDNTSSTTPPVLESPREEEPTALPLSTMDQRTAVAVYITDYDNRLQSVVLAMIHADLTDTKISTIGLPKETVLGNVTLEDWYADSVESAQAALNTYFSKTESVTPVKNYFVFTYYEIPEVIDGIKKRGNRFLFTLENDLYENPDDGGESINLSAGKQSLISSQVTDLFRYTAWPLGTQQRAQKHAEIVAAFLNQTIPDADPATLKNNHTLLYTASLISDYNAAAYEPSAPVFKEIAGCKNTEICQTLDTKGTFSDAATRFTLDETCVHAVQELLLH